MANVDYNNVGGDEAIIHPRNDLQQELTREIEQYCRPALTKATHISLTRDFEIYTITAQTLIALIDRLGNEAGVNVESTIELWPLLGAAIDAKDSDAEKDGNLNIVFYQPDEAEKVQTVDDLAAYVDEVIRPNTNYKGYWMKVRSPQEDGLMKQLSDTAAARLFEKNNIRVTDHRIVLPIACYFIQGMFDVLSKKCIESGRGMIYDLNDVIEVKVVLRNNVPMIRVNPGVCSKLTIKQDGITEKDY